MTTDTAADVPRLEWAEFRETFRRGWQQGEHVSLIGPTGCGKTTLGRQIAEDRSFVTVLGTKPTLRPDPTLDGMRREGYRVRRHADDIPTYVGQAAMRELLWPTYRMDLDKPRQAYELDRALRRLFTEGGWTVLADEAYYLCKLLGLQSLLELWWIQGRSQRCTMIAATQRPAHVPLLMYDQATHLFFWKDNDETNLRRVGGLGSLNARTVRAVVGSLAKHDCLYVNTRTDELIVTRAERK